MSKLIGTNPNQVPSNADLGSAAFMDAKDFLTARGSSLSAIDAIIPKTARDVFIYDTSLDSDGGAWRKRVSHTSWYNETLNTTTRGSRRDFPSVAVIICIDTGLVIYDADDPNLPMWMVFTLSAGAILYSTSPNAAAMLDGQMVVAGGSSQTFNQINFVSDIGFFRNSNGTWWNVEKIADRNRVSGPNSNGTIAPIRAGTTYDVDMIVVSGAPIDEATGLPIPTMAVGTAAGASIIRDTGLVYDLATSAEARNVSFGENGDIYVRVLSGGADAIYGWRLPNADDTFANPFMRYNDQSWSAAYQRGAFTPRDFKYSKDELIIGGNEGLTKTVSTAFAGVGGDDSDFQNYITTTYNTGWIPGAIKLATLNDTEAGSISTTDVVTNGTFDTDLSGWSIGGDITYNSGTAHLTNTDTYGAVLTQLLTGLKVGSRYILTLDVTGISGNYGWYIDNFFGVYVQGVTTATGSFIYELTATNTSSYIIIKKFNAGTVAVDNVSIRLAEADRSISAKSLLPFGTIRKTPVAAGADLVAYSGFTSGDYNGVRFEQPYPFSDNLNPGSGDYSISFWLKDVGAGCDVMGLGKRGTDLSWNIYHDAGGGLRLTVSYNGTSYQSIVEIQFGGSIDRWTHVVFTKVGDIYSAYLNGNFYTSNTGTSDTLYTTSRAFMIGSGHTNNNIVGDPKYALLKLSKTAPTPDQIKKMYEDEKVLFEENAKATLYGTSDTVYAVAYDKSTNLVHAGTPSGRSVFQGLRRVDNTTDAVGTAISAVNGMVVEE